MHYWPALDGLRGLAVIAVMLFHAQWPAAQGGFLGVDIFFVLSGFLITAQLFQESQATGRVSLGAFFMRRVVRLQPALLLLLLVYGLCAAWSEWLPPSVARSWPTDITIVTLALSHWARAWDWHAPDYLGHTWSLGIEEQFYLLWAVAMAWCAQAGLGLAALTRLAFLAAACSAGWMALLYLSGASPSRLYNGLDTRAMALLMGCTLALSLIRSHSGHVFRDAAASLPTYKRSTPSWDRVGGWAALLALVAGMHLLSWKHPVMFIAGYACTALIAAYLVRAIVLNPTSGCAALLSCTPLVRVGQWSYGLYLWHYPLFRIAEYQGGLHGVPLGTSMAAASVVTFLLAATSYYLLELPLRRQYALRRARANTLSSHDRSMA